MSDHCPLTALVVSSVISVGFGWFIFINPLKAFKIQKAFYRLINWHIEPISMSKEIRNTKWMGIFLMLFVAGVWIYYLLLKNK